MLGTVRRRRTRASCAATRSIVSSEYASWRLRCRMIARSGAISESRGPAGSGRPTREGLGAAGGDAVALLAKERRMREMYRVRVRTNAFQTRSRPRTWRWGTDTLDRADRVGGLEPGKQMYAVVVDTALPDLIH